jgi:hypothetical protein
MSTSRHELDDDTPLIHADGNPYTPEQRYGFFVGLANHLANQYKWDRASQYPRIEEQLDMLWHMMDDETIPGKNSEWYSVILAVKQNYPKP